MSSDSDEWRVTTDRSRIVDWAEANDLVPVRAGDGDDAALDIVSAPGDRDVRRIEWEEFFERFEAEGLALRYREGEAVASRSEYELVERSPTTDDDSADRGDRRDEGLLDDPFSDSRQTGHENAEGGGAGEPETERMALSDTGDAEPVAEDELESEAAGEREDGDDTDGETAMSESSSGSERSTLVLDEIYEAPGLGDSADDEYVVFRNTGEEPIDLSGWTVENEAGDDYEFPDGFELGPSESVTLYTDYGKNTDHELHWGSEDAVWAEQGGTVVVRSPGGERVIRERFKG